MQCYLCNSRQGYSLKVSPFWRCGECGLVQQTKQIKVDYKIANLEDHLVASSPMTKLVYGWGGKWLLDRYYWLAYGQRKQLVERLVAGGKLLDVGCESGTFIKQFGSGWQVQGVEINPKIGKLGGENVWIGDVAKFNTKQKFEIVTMWHVLEHLQDPQQVVKQLAKLVVPGGYVIIEVPNGDSWYMRLFGKYWRLWMYPQHRWFWTGDSLRRLVAKQGFEVVKTEHTGLLSAGPGSLADWAKSPVLGVLSIPLFMVINVFVGRRRDNVRIVVRCWDQDSNLGSR